MAGKNRPLGIEAGLVIAERYRIEGPIERGAMGAVWRATHIALESPVAIKFLNPAIAGDPEMLARFLREAKSSALVRSTHVVQVFDYGVEHGTPYIVMELLLGESLEQRLAKRGVLAPADLDQLFGEVAKALAVAHEMGVIHRDLKPGNIYIAREGGHEITKVLDFGIAKCLDQKLAATAGTGTQTGVTLGTPHYMSAEQARGDRNLDRRTDIWSLAVVAFQCLTGNYPFRGEALGDLIVNICVSEPVPPSAFANVPLNFDAWFLRGVMKDPEARYENVTEMARALHCVLREAALGSAGESQRALLPALSVAPSSELGRSANANATEQLASVGLRRRRPKVLAATLGVGTAATLLVWFFWGGAPEPMAVGSAPAPALASEGPPLSQAAPSLEGTAAPVPDPALLAASAAPSRAEGSGEPERAAPPVRAKQRTKSAKRKNSKAPSPVAAEAPQPAERPRSPTDPFAHRL